MTGKQIVKIVFLVILILLASATFVVGFIMKGTDNTPAGKRKFRLLVRIRVGCFLAMLVSLLIVVLIT